MSRGFTNMSGLKSILLLSLATLLPPVFAQQQGANPARPGSLNYVEGQASIDGRQVTARSVGQAEVEPGQYLATANGKAEMLLTPGVFLRLDKNSTVKMIKPDLTHTEVSVEQGRAEVEADQLYPQNMILIDQKGGQTQILKNGLYEFNADANTVRTFDGKAAVYPGNDLESKVKPVEVKGGKQITLVGEAVKPVSFNKDRSQDDLYRWSELRSQYLGEANVDLAAQYAGYGPSMATAALRLAGPGIPICMDMTGCRAVGRSSARLATASTRRTTCTVAALCMAEASMGAGTAIVAAMGSVAAVEGTVVRRSRAEASMAVEVSRAGVAVASTAVEVAAATGKR
jgi:hypothetical protein